MNGKAWYQSKACIGGCVAAIIGIISMFTAVGPALEKEQGAITDGLVGLAEIFAGIMAIYGRIAATKRIGGPRGSKLYGWIILLMLIPLAMGCNRGVILQPEYHRAISDLSIVSKELGKRCESGEATADQCGRGLLAVGDGLDAILAEAEGGDGQ